VGGLRSPPLPGWCGLRCRADSGDRGRLHLHRRCPDRLGTASPVRDYLFAAHQSVEVGHRFMLERTGQRPILVLICAWAKVPALPWPCR